MIKIIGSGPRKYSSPCRAWTRRFSFKAIIVGVSVLLMLLQWRQFIVSTAIIKTPMGVTRTKNSNATETAATLSLSTTQQMTSNATIPAATLSLPTAPHLDTRVRPIANPTKLQQIDNYKSGRALLLNMHPVHHAGTAFCNVVGTTGGPVASPRYPQSVPTYCWLDTESKLGNHSEFSFDNKTEFLKSTPVPHEQTGDYIQTLLPHFHMTSWEYNGVQEMHRNLSDTDWEHPDLVSVVITRDPISRLLAGDGKLSMYYGGYNKGTLPHSGWWNLAVNRFEADNFFLRILGGTKRKQNKPVSYTEDNLPSVDSLRGDFDIDETHYQRAVAMLNRFTVVLDIACLDDGLGALQELFGLNQTLAKERREILMARRKSKGWDKRNSTKDRIGYEDVYDYLLEKHEWDIKLYEYSKTISLVNCDMVRNHG